MHTLPICYAVGDISVAANADGTELISRADDLGYMRMVKFEDFTAQTSTP
jgi:hypothetical protein